MSLPRKDIMNMNDKELAFKHINSHVGWDSQRKAVERSNWKRLHEPNLIRKYEKQKKDVTIANIKPTDLIERILHKIERLQQKQRKIVNKINMYNDMLKQHTGTCQTQPCHICEKDSEDYDLPCKHPICFTCFNSLIKDSTTIECGVCNKIFTFSDEKYLS